MAVQGHEGSHQGTKQLRSSPASVDSRPVVLFVGMAGGAGGSTRSLTTVLRELRSSYRMVLVAPRGGGFEALAAGIPDEWIDASSARATRWLPMYKAIKAAWHHRERLAAVHANGLTAVNVAAAASLILRVPLVVWVHNFELSTWSRRFAPLWRVLLRHATWAAVSATARQLIVDGGVARPEQVEIVPNPIDPHEYVTERAPGDGRVRLGYLGGTSRRKGFDLLPGVVEATLSARSRWLVYTNLNPRDAELAAALEHLQALPDDEVLVSPRVRDPRDAYRQCDLVFMPSRSESFGRVAAEAMMNGIPTVASDIDPLREVLVEGAAGLLFPTGDVEAAAACLNRLIEDGPLRTRLGEEGRRLATGYKPAAIAATLRGLYDPQGAANGAGQSSKS